MSFKIWMVLSDWPSVWGWKAILNLNCVPNASWNDLQNLDVNYMPLSDIIEIGTPCIGTIRIRYNLAYWATVYVMQTGKKCAVLVNLSTITNIESNPLAVLGNLVTKSIVILSHFHSGMSKIWSVPAGFWCSVLTYRHVRHLTTKSTTSIFMPFHQ